MNSDEVYDRRRIVLVSEQLRSIEILNKEACLMATQCQDIVLIHQKIKEYTEREPFRLKASAELQKPSRRARECLKMVIKSCDGYLKRNYHLLAQIILIRERSKVALERCCRCESLGRGERKCPLLETLADLGFDNELHSASFGRDKKKESG